MAAWSRETLKVLATIYLMEWYPSNTIHSFTFTPDSTKLTPFLANVTTLRSLMAITIPSVCCLWRWCTLLRRLNFSAIFFTIREPRDSTFLVPKSFVGDVPFPWNLRSKWPTPFQKAQFRPISAHSASTVIASEKSSISTYRKSTTRFPTSHI